MQQQMCVNISASFQDRFSFSSLVPHTAMSDLRLSVTHRPDTCFISSDVHLWRDVTYQMRYSAQQDYRLYVFYSSNVKWPHISFHWIKDHAQLCLSLDVPVSLSPYLLFVLLSFNDKYSITFWYFYYFFTHWKMNRCLLSISVIPRNGFLNKSIAGRAFPYFLLNRMEAHPTFIPGAQIGSFWLMFTMYYFFLSDLIWCVFVSMLVFWTLKMVN